MKSETVDNVCMTIVAIAIVIGTVVAIFRMAGCTERLHYDPLTHVQYVPVPEPPHQPEKYDGYGYGESR